MSQVRLLASPGGLATAVAEGGAAGQVAREWHGTAAAIDGDGSARALLQLSADTTGGHHHYTAGGHHTAVQLSADTTGGHHHYTAGGHHTAVQLSADTKGGHHQYTAGGSHHYTAGGNHTAVAGAPTHTRVLSTPCTSNTPPAAPGGSFPEGSAPAGGGFREGSAVASASPRDHLSLAYQAAEAAKHYARTEAWRRVYIYI